MVECAGLEIRYTVSPYRGFESLLLRQGHKAPQVGAFCFPSSPQGCHRDTAAGVAAERLPASAYDSWLAARITAFACFSSFAFVRRELGPEMHMEPSSRQFTKAPMGAPTEPSASPSSSEILRKVERDASVRP